MGAKVLGYPVSSKTLTVMEYLKGKEKEKGEITQLTLLYPQHLMNISPTITREILKLAPAYCKT